MQGYVACLLRSPVFGHEEIIGTHKGVISRRLHRHVSARLHRHTRGMHHPAELHNEWVRSRGVYPASLSRAKRDHGEFVEL